MGEYYFKILGARFINKSTSYIPYFESPFYIGIVGSLFLKIILIAKYIIQVLKYEKSILKNNLICFLIKDFAFLFFK